LLGLYVAVGALVWFSRPTPVFFVAGASLVALGEAIRVWAAGHLVKSLELIDSGPYAYTQNPLYLGRLLILSGICVSALTRLRLNWILLLVGYVLFFGYYLPRKVRVEGNRLRKMHGDAWVQYNAVVPILVPSLTRYRGRDRAWSLTRAFRNQELLVLIGILLILAVLAYKTWP
jgi:protein-S-isoprenylcysteine O-methyltransferase Ste14